MISARQIRAARGLLHWTQRDLADRAIVALNTVSRLENGSTDARGSSVQAIQTALMRAGIEFTGNDGVKFRA